MSLDMSVLERHLDLTPLRGRRRGLVRCIFHVDRHPSLSIDLDRGLFNCFTCGEHGGVRRFAELIGEPAGRTSSRGDRVPPETDVDRARREALAHDRRLTAKRAEWLPWWFANDHIRRCWNAARDARRIATQLGPDDPRIGDLLARAAQVECEGLMVEAALDAILAEGSISE